MPDSVGDFWTAVTIYCGKLGASVTSGYRTPARNASVGGVLHSRHQIGMAADVVYDTAVSAEAKEQTARQLGLIVIEESDHDHLQT